MSETEQKVAPALTAEEWANVTVQIEEGYDNKYAIARLSEMDDADGPILQIWPEGDSPVEGFASCGRELHRVAALCLHGQPFGFTHEDVALLSICSDRWMSVGEQMLDEAEAAGDKEAFDRRLMAVSNLTGAILDLADRIEALLPPRE